MATVAKYKTAPLQCWPKAKELRFLAERMITLGKRGGLHRRRQAISFLQDEMLVHKLFGPLAERYKERSGGYTRVLRAGFRHGDNAPLGVIELVDRDPEAKGAGDKARHAAQQDAAAAAE